MENYGYPNLYDCTTFGNMTYLENATLYGYRAGSGGAVTPEYSDPIIVLKQKEN